MDQASSFMVLVERNGGTTSPATDIVDCRAAMAIAQAERDSSPHARVSIVELADGEYLRTVVHAYDPIV